MKNLQFPLQFIFRYSTLSKDFIVKDSEEKTIAFIQQKLLKLIEEVTIYREESKEDIYYKIKADRWLDFSANYIMRNSQNLEMGRVVRKGWKSLWKARYEIYDKDQKQIFAIQEKSGWVNFFDSMLELIPIADFFTNYILNPTYYLTRMDGEKLLCLKKNRTFLGRHFNVEKLTEFKEDEEEIAVLGLMMMILLEKYK